MSARLAFSDEFRKQLAEEEIVRWSADFKEEHLTGLIWAVGEFGRRSSCLWDERCEGPIPVANDALHAFEFIILGVGGSDSGPPGEEVQRPVPPPPALREELNQKLKESLWTIWASGRWEDTFADLMAAVGVVSLPDVDIDDYGAKWLPDRGRAALEQIVRIGRGERIGVDEMRRRIDERAGDLAEKTGPPISKTLRRQLAECEHTRWSGTLTADNYVALLWVLDGFGCRASFHGEDELVDGPEPLVNTALETVAQICQHKPVDFDALVEAGLPHADESAPAFTELFRERLVMEKGKYSTWGAYLSERELAALLWAVGICSRDDVDIESYIGPQLHPRARPGLQEFIRIGRGDRFDCEEARGRIVAGDLQHYLDARGEQ